MNLICYLFADDLAIVISGTLEIEKQAAMSKKVLDNNASNNLLPVNTNKTKALLVYDVVGSSYLKAKYKGILC